MYRNRIGSTLKKVLIRNKNRPRKTNRSARDAHRVADIRTLHQRLTNEDLAATYRAFFAIGKGSKFIHEFCMHTHIRRQNRLAEDSAETRPTGGMVQQRAHPMIPHDTEQKLAMHLFQGRLAIKHDRERCLRIFLYAKSIKKNAAGNEQDDLP